jgi:4-hydroxy-3-polyprenylbenzoate decarboxylase
MGVIQVEKQGVIDDKCVVDAGLAALRLASPFKHIILVDEDIDPHSAEDLWWALTMRYQADIDTHIIDNDKPFLMDPSQLPIYRNSISKSVNSAKALFDCTVPWAMKDVFKRPFLA